MEIPHGLVSSLVQGQVYLFQSGEPSNEIERKCRLRYNVLRDYEGLVGKMKRRALENVLRVASCQHTIDLVARGVQRDSLELEGRPCFVERVCRISKLHLHDQTAGDQVQRQPALLM